MVISTETVIMAASLLTAAITILATVFSVYRWYLRQNGQDTDIKEIKSEQCMHTYVMMAILDGLKQQGCNGKVTEAQDRLQKYINKHAHDMED